MASAKPMLPTRGRAFGGAAGGATLVVTALLLWAAAASGCKQPADPVLLDSPLRDYQLWGVAPFRNESGVSIVDTARLADAFTAEAEQAGGVHTVPVNRVIQAMRRLGLSEIATHRDALAVLRELDADGLVVGTVTAYDAYRPLHLGLAVQLYFRPPGEGWSGLDARALTRAIGGPDAADPAAGGCYPIAQAAGVFDGASQLTRRLLNEYAAGRVAPETAYGSDIYLVSMDSFAHFVCYRLIHDLLRQEQALATPVAAPSQ